MPNSEWEGEFNGRGPPGAQEADNELALGRSRKDGIILTKLQEIKEGKSKTVQPPQEK